jgi:hypothetical protein
MEFKSPLACNKVAATERDGGPFALRKFPSYDTACCHDLLDFRVGEQGFWNGADLIFDSTGCLYH